MKPFIVALHGFLGQGRDWGAVSRASKADLHWICPDLFSPIAGSLAPPRMTDAYWLAGYSFGARLALRWMQEAPEHCLGALLLSVNPGNFQSEEDRAARGSADRVWASRFRERPWEELMRDWDAQKVFGGDAGFRRDETDFDRENLAAAMEKLSVADQFTDPLRLPPRIAWLAGARDTKFCALLDDMRNAGFPGSFLRIGGAGHRLLHDAPEAVADALDNLVA